MLPIDISDLQKIGCVLIGRNEGQRLTYAITSIPETIRQRSVYVDSGSTDGSQDYARTQGLQLVELSPDMPFTAARARNAGAKKLLENNPELDFIQFFDGDCTLIPGWIETAISFLKNHPDTALVCGRRRERHPHQSIYNWLCDVEWNTPLGITQSCGGDFLIRAEVFEQVNGFSSDLIAGEEPDMCFRIRKLGHTIYRINHDMTYHDANITTFQQWFKRSIRAGYAYSEAVVRHRHEPNGYWRRNLIRLLFWGITLPTIVVATALSIHPVFSALLVIYPAHVIHIALRSKIKEHKWMYGLFMMISKFSETFGLLLYLRNRLLSHSARLIEYK